MPRTTTLQCPGCPPLRALTFDSLGLIKVLESREKGGGFPVVVEKWGTPEPSFAPLAVSMGTLDDSHKPVLAVARKHGGIDILNPLNGHVNCTIPYVSEDNPSDDPISGLHLLETSSPTYGESSRTLLTCTSKGKATVRHFDNVFQESVSCIESTTWNICTSGSILCSKVDFRQTYAVFGGKGVELKISDLNLGSIVWTAKSPPKDSLGIFTPTWFTCATFLNEDSHCKVVAGTNSHQVRLYDIKAQRRPVLSFNFGETSIKAITEDPDGHTVYVGNGSGDLAAFDMRTGKSLGSFLGKCSGSIRSIARHPKLPVLASCGLDSHLRLWDVETRQLLSAVFLKQHLVSVVFDSQFTVDEKVVPVKRVGTEDGFYVEEGTENGALTEDKIVHNAIVEDELGEGNKIIEGDVKIRKPSKDKKGSKKKHSRDTTSTEEGIPKKPKSKKGSKTKNTE